MVHSKQNSQSEGERDPSENHSMRHGHSNLIRTEDNENRVQLEEEMCPVCQERLSNQKMVFQCGHITCCKCKFLVLHQPHISGYSASVDYLL